MRLCVRKMAMLANTLVGIDRKEEIILWIFPFGQDDKKETLRGIPGQARNDGRVVSATKKASK